MENLFKTYFTDAESNCGEYVYVCVVWGRDVVLNIAFRVATFWKINIVCACESEDAVCC